MTRLRLLLIATAILALPVVFSSSATATNGTWLITEDTVLTGDHHGSIEIVADDVTLDCRGHRIIGDGSDLSEGIRLGRVFSYSGPANVTVTNCRISNFDDGVIVFDADGLTISNNRITENKWNAVQGENGVVGDNVLVVGNRFDHNWNGLMQFGGTNLRVVGNTASDNAGMGIAIDYATTFSLEGNTVVRNFTYGISIYASSDGTVLNNTSSGNQGGLWITQSESIEFASNTLNDNRQWGWAAGYYYGVPPASRLLDVHHNTANHNFLGGFRLLGTAESNTLHHNTANNNGSAYTGYGFLATQNASGNTISHNTARNNGLYDGADDSTGSGNTWEDNNFGSTLLP